jgi:hypothetical protein
MPPQSKSTRILVGVYYERIFSYGSRSVVIPFAQVEPVVAVRQCWVGPKTVEAGDVIFQNNFSDPLLANKKPDL